VTFAIVSAVSLAIFIPWEMARKDPIVEVRLLFQQEFGLAFLVMLAVGGSHIWLDAACSSTAAIQLRIYGDDFGIGADSWRRGDVVVDADFRPPRQHRAA
jgi:hypothetical protein